jgi:Fe-S-cluster containining protein
MSDGLEHLRALWGKVDSHFARVAGRVGAAMRCQAGCASCCVDGLTVTSVEAAALEALVAALPAAERAALGRDVARRQAGVSSEVDPDERSVRGTVRSSTAAALPPRAPRPGRAAPTGCVALDPQGGCRVYAARPLVCRSHGLPIRLREPGRLPVVTSCELNFVDGGAAATAPEDQLDQLTLSTILAAVDQEHCTRTAQPLGTRRSLIDLLSGLDERGGLGERSGLDERGGLGERSGLDERGGGADEQGSADEPPRS